MNYTRNELYHFGILGMKWGVRRFQNKDGTLTAAGRRRLTRLSKRREAAINDYNKTSAKMHKKIASTESQIASKRTKADHWFVSEKRATKLRSQAYNLESKLKTMQYKVSSKSTAVSAANSKMNTFLSRLPYDSVFKGRSLTDEMLDKVGAVSMSSVYQTDDGYNAQYYKKVQKYIS